MSVFFPIASPCVEQSGAVNGRTRETEWAVVHPSNGAILAYCTTEREARHVADEIAQLAKRLGKVDET